MTSNSLSFKVYLHLSQNSVEVRRFGLAKEEAGKFAPLKAKISNVFPALNGKEFLVHYHDDENEKVVIGSDEEFMIAMSIMPSKDPYRLHLEVAANESQACSTDLKSAEGELHSHVTCDGCDGPVRGFRYKCMECPDYDLCARCEAKAFHPGHRMMRVALPSMMPPYCPYVKNRTPMFPQRGRCGMFYRPTPMEPASFASGATREEKVPNPEERKPQFRRSDPTEILKNIGDAVSSMLDVLGIDVQVQLVPPTGEGRNEGTAAPTQPLQTDIEGQDQPKVAEVTPDRDVPIVFSPGLFGWTLVNSELQKQQKDSGKDAETSTTEEVKSEIPQETQTDKPSAPSPISVEERIVLSLERMAEMGFTNDGNWLGQLLMMKNGSIDAVLEILNPRK